MRSFTFKLAAFAVALVPMMASAQDVQISAHGTVTGIMTMKSGGQTLVTSILVRADDASSVLIWPDFIGPTAAIASQVSIGDKISVDGSLANGEPGKTIMARTLGLEKQPKVASKLSAPSFDDWQKMFAGTSDADYWGTGSSGMQDVGYGVNSADGYGAQLTPGVRLQGYFYPQQQTAPVAVKPISPVPEYAPSLGTMIP